MEKVEKVSQQDLDNLFETQESEIGTEIKVSKKPLITDVLGNSVRDMAVERQLVSQGFRDAVFDRKTILDNMKRRNKIDNLDPVRKEDFEAYASTCEGVLTALRAGQLPARSYLIGAPTGFGAAEFANEAVITMLSRGMKAVPYVSLSELGAVRAAQEKIIARPVLFERTKYGDLKPVANEYPEYLKSPDMITGRYSFSEYLNADCLFVFFSGTNSKEIESELLKQVLMIRGAKGLPTIAMISSALKYYTLDPALKEYVWDNILTQDENCKDKAFVYHVSCYRVKLSLAERRDFTVDEETGFVVPRTGK